MAEFCLECWNRINGTKDSGRKYMLSKELDLCEGCGEWKPVIIVERKTYYMNKFGFFTLIIRMVCGFIYSTHMLIKFLFQHNKTKK